MSNHHSFGYSLAHDGEKVEVLDRAVRKERYGAYRNEPGWESDLWTRYWRMRMINLWVNVARAVASKEGR